ncbi:MAG: MgtC/SapB family protein [Alicyclobacillaceae bacterium]|nr:MgtC/SapB family protein [Alicyclobacillaceae bacterium]
MSWDLNVVFVFRLLLSILLGGILGWERERKHKSAGLKTHILISVAGCLLMWLSTYAFEAFADRPHVQFDPSRLAAQVGGGIGGFLAAGIVFRSDRFAISGYSTAAMLLLALIVGFAVGAGQYFVSAVTVFSVVACMVWLPSLQRKIHKPRYRHLTYVSLDRPALLAEVTAILGQYGVNITDVAIQTAEDDVVTTTLEVSSRPDLNWGELMAKIRRVEDVLSVSLE